MKPILLMSAVDAELAPLLPHLHDKEPLTMAGRTGYSASLNGRPLILLTTGPGAINTAQSLTVAMERFSPEFIVQVGCGGGFASAGVSVGDVAVATEEIDAHMGIEDYKQKEGLLPLPFPLMERRGRAFTHRFPLSQGLADEVIAAIKAPRPFTHHKGPFISASTITATDERAQGLYALYGTVMESMEGAAAAHIAIHYDTPFVEIRGASNLVGRRDKGAWDLPVAFRNSCACALAFLRQRCTAG